VLTGRPVSRRGRATWRSRRQLGRMAAKTTSPLRGVARLFGTASDATDGSRHGSGVRRRPELFRSDRSDRLTLRMALNALTIRNNARSTQTGYRLGVSVCGDSSDTESLMASLGAYTRFCLVPRYRSVVCTDACPNNS